MDGLAAARDDGAKNKRAGWICSTPPVRSFIGDRPLVIPAGAGPLAEARPGCCYAQPLVVPQLLHL